MFLNPRTNNKTYSTYIFLAPWIVSFIVFSLYPIIFSILISFTRYSPLNPQATVWLGLTNYFDVLTDPVFWKALRNTLFFVIGTIPFTTSISLGIAILINQKIPLRQLYRAGFFIPTTLSLVIISIVFKHIYAPRGYLNFLVSLCGGTPVSWLQDTRFALPAIMFMDVWASIGYYMVLFLAALQSIPKEMYESAEIDGSTSWKKFLYITLPYLRPMTLFIVVINTIRSFQIFIEIFVMTRGGPLNSTLTVVYYLYDHAFYRFDMGYASAVAYLLLIIILSFSLVQMKFFRLERAIGD